MLQASRRWLHTRWVVASLAILSAVLVVGVWASVNDPGPTAFLELDAPANVGFDNTAGATYDWANSGANATPRDCTATAVTGGTLLECNGLGGLFDGGVFHNATTVPDSPEYIGSSPNILAAEFRVDPLSVDVGACGTGDPTVFTAVGGEVNGDDLNTETFSTGSVPNKDEISNAYAISHQDPPNAFDGDPDNINELFAGFERVVNNGDSHVDLEFLQESVNLVPGSKPAQFPCAGKFQGHRSEGDLLLSVDFTNGGEVGTQVLHQWVCGDFPPTVRKICDPVKSPGKKTPPHYELVDNALTLAAVQQNVNSVDAVGCGGWACRNANGTRTDTIAKNQLYEVGIDLAALGFEGCLSTFLPHTRSSQSFTATLKDFEIIPFNTCTPSTNLTKQASASEVVTGSSVTYTYVETNDGNVPLKNPSVTDDKCSPVAYQSGDTNTNDVLDPGEAWTFTCTVTNLTQNTTNTAVGHGTFEGPNGDEDVTFCSDPSSPPAGVRCDQDERAQATVTVLNPSTRLTKAASASVVTTVSYTYQETNDGQVPLTSVSVSDDKCSPVVYQSGDTNLNSALDPNETWTFTCTATYNGGGTFTNVAVGHGSFTSAGVTRDVTVCGSGSNTGKFCDADETDTKTVTVCTPTVTGGK
jgi:hypothetical protein